MGVKAPLCLGCEELGAHNCDKGPVEVGDGGVAGIELLELFPLRTEGGDGGSGERVK